MRARRCSSCCTAGWTSASFQFLVDALRGDWQVIAPDWRGYGLTDWAPSDAYWFPDYFGDLDALLAHLQPDAPATLVGHSMGGNVAALYAGIRPGRVAKLVNLEGFGMAATRGDEAPKRYARWLDELATAPSFRDYESFDALADRLCANNPRLTRERAHVPRAALGQGQAGRACGAGKRSGAQARQPGALPSRGIRSLLAQRYRAGSVGVRRGDESRGDAQADPRRSRRAQGLFRQITERVVPGRGHMMHHDQPERLAQLIEEFLHSRLCYRKI